MTGFYWCPLCRVRAPMPLSHGPERGHRLEWWAGDSQNGA